MEILGYLYANGYGTGRDPVEAYIWYGRAALEGKMGMKPNMDLLWSEIVGKDSLGADRIRAYFANYQPRRRAAQGEAANREDAGSSR